MTQDDAAEERRAADGSEGTVLADLISLSARRASSEKGRALAAAQTHYGPKTRAQMDEEAAAVAAKRKRSAERTAQHYLKSARRAAWLAARPVTRHEGNVSPRDEDVLSGRGRPVSPPPAPVAPRRVAPGRPGIWRPRQMVHQCRC